MKCLIPISEEEREILKHIISGERKTDEHVFYDLCYAICSPQTKYSATQKVNRVLQDKDIWFYCPSVKTLEGYLKPVRFYKRKALFIRKMYPQFIAIRGYVQSDFLTPFEKRDWLINHVSGLGMKTASHFLRMMGDWDLAIIDTHILKFLGSMQPRNKKEYLQYEKEFTSMAKSNGLRVAELDAYIWSQYANVDLRTVKF